MIRFFFDQGHNPVNPNAGAEANGRREQDITYAVGVRLAALLREDPAFEVRLSRNTPETILGGRDNTSSLAARVNMANEWGADYFVSLHCNASVNTEASGSEVYVYSVPSRASRLGESILVGLNEATGLDNRGVRVNQSLYVLRRTRMPAVLVEMGYISNEHRVKMMTSAWAPKSIARSLFNGFVRYFEQVD